MVGQRRQRRQRKGLGRGSVWCRRLTHRHKPCSRRLLEIVHPNVRQTKRVHTDLGRGKWTEAGRGYDKKKRSVHYGGMVLGTAGLWKGAARGGMVKGGGYTKGMPIHASAL